MPRFVVLFHQTPPGYPRPDHWDLMFEDQGVLRTWALEQAPAVGRTIAAEELPPHRLAYLTLEGPIAGNRGEVTRIHAGDCTVLQATPDLVQVELRGAMPAIACFTRIADQRWSVSFSARASAV